VTNAPANLKAVRTLLLDHLDVNKGLTRSTDLDPDEVGIVGNPDHRGGYHCGSDRVVSGDYSVVESSRDRTGLTLDAAALDVGDFSIRVGGKAHTLASFSVWLVAQCKAGTADTRDIREVIYSPDGKTVKRWDRLGKRSTGDSSHLWHTHISFHRDAIKAGRDLTPLFRRYLTEIGLIKAPQPLEDDMQPSDQLTIAGWGPKTWPDDKGLADGKISAETAWGGAYLHARLGQERAGQLVTMVEALTKLVGGQDASRVLEEIRAQHEQTRAAVAGIVPAVLAELPDEGPVSREDLVAALTSVLGSVDGATPAQG